MLEREVIISTSRVGFRGVPPAASQRDKECYSVLKPLGRSLDVANPRLVVLNISNQDLKVIGGAGPIIGVDQA